MPFVLQPLDLLLFRVGPTADFIARTIGWAEQRLKEPGTAQYYHVGFVGPDIKHYYESRVPRIKNTDMPDPIPPHIEVYRFISEITPASRAFIYSYANSQLGKWYNLLGVLTAGLIQIGDFPYCSQFAWECYTQGGVTICPYSSLLSPDDVASSRYLLRVF